MLRLEATGVLPRLVASWWHRDLNFHSSAVAETAYNNIGAAERASMAMSMLPLVTGVSLEGRKLDAMPALVTPMWAPRVAPVDAYGRALRCPSEEVSRLLQLEELKGCVNVDYAIALRLSARLEQLQQEVKSDKSVIETLRHQREMERSAGPKGGVGTLVTARFEGFEGTYQCVIVGKVQDEPGNIKVFCVEDETPYTIAVSDIVGTWSPDHEEIAGVASAIAADGARASSRADANADSDDGGCEGAVVCVVAMMVPHVTLLWVALVSAVCFVVLVVLAVAVVLAVVVAVVVVEAVGVAVAVVLVLLVAVVAVVPVLLLVAVPVVSRVVDLVLMRQRTPLQEDCLVTGHRFSPLLAVGVAVAVVLVLLVVAVAVVLVLVLVAVPVASRVVGLVLMRQGTPLQEDRLVTGESR
jgi:hypothetical protein